MKILQQVKEKADLAQLVNKYILTKMEEMQMKKLSNQKGSITMLVLVTMLFLLAFLMSSYMIVSNRAQKQKQISNEIQEIYRNKQDLNEVYNSYFNEEVIPIYTAEQLLKIGSGETIQIDNRLCVMTWDATYALMNHLEFDVSSSEVSDFLGGSDWTPINENENFKGYFEGNGYNIKVTNNDGKIETYSSLNNYRIQLSLDKTTIAKEIKEGVAETETLTAKINSTGDLTWTSSDESVASISGTGNTRTITFNEVGNATITVTYGTHTAQCEIIVTEKVVEGEDELAGTWVLNEELSFEELPVEEGHFNYTLFYDLKFSFGTESNEMSYIKIKVEIGPGTNLYWLYYSSDSNIPVYDEGWTNDEYRTIIIATKLSEMENGEEFLNWLKENAIKQS